MRTVSQTKNERENVESNAAFAAMDTEMVCKECGYIITTSRVEAKITRTVSHHSILHGTLDIIVVDVRCNECGFYIPYDGADDALFSLNRKHIFT